MANIVLPTLGIQSFSFGLTRGDITLEYMHGNESFVRSTKAVWSAEFQLAVKKEDVFREWRAALLQLSSFANTTQIVPPEYTYPSGGEVQGICQVTAVSSSARSVSVLFISVGDRGRMIASAGDYVQIRDQLCVLRRDLVTDSSGNATIRIEPPLRTSVRNSLAGGVTWNRPSVTMRLQEPVASWRGTLPWFYTPTLTLIETYGAS